MLILSLIAGALALAGCMVILLYSRRRLKRVRERKLTEENQEILLPNYDFRGIVEPEKLHQETCQGARKEFAEIPREPGETETKVAGKVCKQPYEEPEIKKEGQGQESQQGLLEKPISPKGQLPLAAGTGDEWRSERERESKTVELDKRGGRPRVSGQQRDRERRQDIKPCSLKQEIVCWKKERQWILAVELPEEIVESPELKVLQEGSPLERDAHNDTCWRLADITGQVLVGWTQDGRAEHRELALGENFLLFKLGGEGQGRRVRFPSSGEYLVVVQSSWTRDEALSGPASVAVEAVSIDGYCCHFFSIHDAGSDRIAFRNLEGESIVIPSKASRFELVGTRQEDGDETMGPLFAEKPPRIRALDSLAWDNIGAVVVGEEGSGRHRWRRVFSPVTGSLTQTLPPDISPNGGWYFLRFYDKDDDLVESIDFRSITALKELRIFQPCPFPSEAGHKEVEIYFLFESALSVRPVEAHTRIPERNEERKVVLSIPPDPKADSTEWYVELDGKRQVRVNILVERIWWGLSEEHEPPSEWKDTCLTLSHEHFRATSNKALWILLPRPRWVDAVTVGFVRLKARRYPVRASERVLAIPLRHFGDAAELGDTANDHFLGAWIQRHGKIFEGVLALLPASEAIVPPKVFCFGLGRKKNAVAKVLLREGTGNIKVNGESVLEYFRATPPKARHFLQRLLELDQVRGLLSNADVDISLKGSSPVKSRQVKAAAHALARACMTRDPKLKLVIKRAGFGGAKITKRWMRDRGRGL